MTWSRSRPRARPPLDRHLLRALAAYAGVLGAACVIVYARARIEPAPVPDGAARRWVLEALRADLGAPLAPPPDSARRYAAAGPIVLLAWSGGRPVAEHVEGSAGGRTPLVAALERGRAALSRSPVVERAIRAGRPPRLTLSLALGAGPLLRGVPVLEALAPVPLLEGLRVRLDGRAAVLTPDELLADGAYERGVQTPIPDLMFGVDVEGLVSRLARQIGADEDDVRARGRVERLRFVRLAHDDYPEDRSLDADTLRAAARDGAAFLLRHQRPSGRFTYLYDARTGRERAAPYNWPRHAGTTYFLALAARLLRMPEARDGARLALRHARLRLRPCGGDDRLCLPGDDGRVELGSSALLAIAAAEHLAGGHDDEAMAMLTGLTSFLRAQQRADGEFMHEYDVARSRPVDVQHLYYSGEAAFALVLAHRVTGDLRDLEAARRAMAHLTGAGWSFFGSRYYYGEEHWTCIAAGAAASSPAGVAATVEALDFCRRWAAYNRVLQYRPGETPWHSSGAYGVGPLLVPRLTPVASRTEAFVSTWELERAHGVPSDPALRAQIERGLGALLRYQWRPGPRHLFADPAAAHGGLPGSPLDLTVRNDFVQHAGCAMLRWAEVLDPRTAAR
jgi:hypothetical protein